MPMQEVLDREPEQALPILNDFTWENGTWEARTSSRERYEKHRAIHAGT